MKQTSMTDIDPCSRKYILKAKTKFFEKDVREELKSATLQYKRKMVLLVPDESDQRTAFLTAWMPDSSSEYFELIAEVGAPINAPVRLSVHRGFDEKCDRPYLFVMSKGAEDIFVKFKEGITVTVTTLPANMEEVGDYAPDAIDGNFHVLEER